MFRQGYLHLGAWNGVPIRIHWSTPLGALIFSRFELVPAFWLGFVLLVLFHELGHAFVVQRVRARVISVEVSGIGGLCTWAGDVTPIQRSCIAWGGVWAQLLLLVGGEVARAVYGLPSNVAMAQFAEVFGRANLGLIAINLIPVKPLDGAEAWALFPRLWRRFLRGREQRRLRLARVATLREMDRRDALEAPPDEVKATVIELFARAKDDVKSGRR